MTITHVFHLLFVTSQVSLFHYLIMVRLRATCVFSFTPCFLLISPQSITFNYLLDKAPEESQSVDYKAYRELFYKLKWELSQSFKHQLLQRIKIFARRRRNFWQGVIPHVVELVVINLTFEGESCYIIIQRLLSVHQ
jgi:hypothetical protein